MLMVLRVDLKKYFLQSMGILLYVGYTVCTVNVYGTD
jgi:hypothetical protein